ncbi:MAG: vanadium-dependent haloperoxidase [Cytophagaceae bacterium]|nr:vanadium-dependent haloperoxidase [Gemmatimonadaceae bacterium]
MPSQATQETDVQLSAVKFSNGLASTRWNRRVAGLLALYPPSNGQAATSRILTYLSIAQYRAVLAADASNERRVSASVSAAVGGASVAVLSAFFPLESTNLEAQYDADLAAEQWPGERLKDPVAGEAIGRAVGAAVNASVATDNYNVVSPGTPPVGPGYWVSSASPIVRSLHGTRPFFLTSASQLRSPPPPAFGSPEFVTALAEVRAISDTRTPQQLALANFWNTSVPPFTAGALNLIADSLIEAHQRSEREAARILAYANAAAFDAQIACFDTKFTYWFIRPSQADIAITLPIGLPNHPSYPSAHSCITGALMTVVAEALPSERRKLNGIIELAGLSRIYGGIHYQFDVEAGQEIGRAAAALALSGSLR